MALVEVEGLVKVFRVTRKQPGVRGALKSLFRPDSQQVRAVDGVSFNIERGEMIGYLGPNGAGKSTTIKMLTGILHPTSGRVTIDGRSPHTERAAVVRDIGVVFGQRTQLYWDLRLGESFELLRRIYRVPAETYRERSAWLTEVLALGDLMDVPVRSLSLGQRMRGEIAAAFLHCPRIILFDEPTIGLDIEAKHRIRDFIRTLNSEYGTTVLLTTHDLGDVQALCRRLIVINHGRVVEDGPLDSLVARLAPYRILVIDCEEAPANFSYPGVEVLTQANGRLKLRFDPTLVNTPDLIAGLSKRLAVRDLSVQDPDIEEVIKQVYSGEKARLQADLVN